jgi:hypothetical protein
MKLSGSLLSTAALLGAVAIAEAQPHIPLSPALMTGCDQATYISTNTTTPVVIAAGIAGQGIYVCGWDLTASSAGSVTVENSAGGTCSSVSASFSLLLSSTSPLVDHVPFYSGAMAVPAGNNLCFVNNNSSSTVSGFVYWTQF